MSSRTLYRLSGGTLIVGSFLLLLASIVGALLFPGHSNTPAQVLGTWWPLVMLTTLIGSLLFVIGLPGMYLHQAGGAGVLGLIGFILLFFAIVLEGTAFSSVQIVVLPLLAQKAPQLLGGNSLPLSAFLLLLISGLMQMIGTILLGIATLRARIFPRWTGVLLLISGIAFLLGMAPFPSPLSDLPEMAAFLTLAVACSGCGALLMGPRNKAAEAAPFAETSAQGSR